MKYTYLKGRNINKKNIKGIIVVYALSRRGYKYWGSLSWTRLYLTQPQFRPISFSYWKKKKNIYID